MALKKLMTLGMDKVEYFRIIGLYPNTLYNSVIVKIAAYANKEARDKSEADYLRVIPMQINGMSLDKEQAYNKIKTKPPFDGAEDC